MGHWSTLVPKKNMPKLPKAITEELPFLAIVMENEWFEITRNSSEIG